MNIFFGAIILLCITPVSLLFIIFNTLIHSGKNMTRPKKQNKIKKPKKLTTGGGGDSADNKCLLNFIQIAFTYHGCPCLYNDNNPVFFHHK